MRKRLINGQVFDGEQFLPKEIVIENGIIQSIEDPHHAERDHPVLLDVKGAMVLPGFIDPHVHFNDPGRADWEGFPTGSSGAAAGGITTVFDMPLNSHPSANTSTVLNKKKQALQGRSYTNYGLWAGMTADVVDHEKELEAMIDCGVVGFKGFMSDSGIDDFKRLNRSALFQAMKFCAQSNSLLALHAEWEETLSRSSYLQKQSPRSFLDSRPVKAEMDAVKLAMEAAAKYGTKVHIVHVSHPDVVDIIQTAKKSGVDATLETCPHYLLFNEEDFIREGPLLKCAPPVRDSESVEGLWDRIGAGQIDFISSDHSPCPPSMKLAGVKDIRDSWGGIQSVQFGTTAFLSEAKKRGLSLSNVLPLLTSNISKRFPPLQTQGEIKVGMEAHFAIYEPAQVTLIEKQDILFRHNYSPYVGKQIEGRISHTIVHGEVVFDRPFGMIGPFVGRDICAEHSRSFDHL
ncbi:allantoinase AllB [Salipaludibacillus keqinensis]|uniref:allantoinase n=1 Tax=Salipaludibacillus keqinensis TaxID=2045207 RepID=A0A323TIK3_9BACI|nr:allantoinase AllB [Salipaludibacillus keqinensis]PYZ94741.1 allantoinase AllB [Salipaludibacillus keqinensis]